MRDLPDVSQVWRGNHPWAPIYDFVVERGTLGPALWRLAMGSDLTKLYRLAEEEIGALPDGSAVLDVPCGGGVALRGLRPEQELRYVAADIAPAMLERARRAAAKRGLDQVELVEADAERLPFGEDQFDLVVAFTSLHCFPHPGVAVAELARVLRPGGRLVGSAFLTDAGLRYEPGVRLGRLSGLLGPSGTTPELRGWLERAGFTDIELDRSGALTYFSSQVQLRGPG